MSSISISGDHSQPNRLKKLMSFVDRVGLGLMYAFVIAVLPFTAADFLSRTV